MEHSNDTFLVIYEDCGDYHYYPRKSAKSVKFLYKLFNSFEMLNKIGFTICETIKEDRLTIKNVSVSIVADFSASRPMVSNDDYYKSITENGEDEEEPIPDMLSVPLLFKGFDIDESKSTKDHIVMDLDEPLDILMNILDDVFPTEFKNVELSKYIIKDKKNKPERSIYTLDIQNMLDEDDETGLIEVRSDIKEYISKTLARVLSHRNITIDYILAA